MLLAENLKRLGTETAFEVLARAAELQRDGMLSRIMPEQPVAWAVNDRIGHHHLGIEKRMPADLPMQVSAMAISPVDHRGNRKDFAASFQRVAIHGKPF